MAYRKSVQARYSEPPATLTSANELIQIVADYRMPALAANMEAGTIVEMLAIPADAIITNARIMSEACDTHATPTFSLKVGFMSGEYLSEDDGRDVTGDFFDATTIVRGGGQAATTKVIETLLALPSNVARAVGIKVVGAPATPVGDARIRLVVDCVAEPRGLTSVTPG